VRPLSQAWVEGRELGADVGQVARHVAKQQLIPAGPEPDRPCLGCRGRGSHRRVIGVGDPSEAEPQLVTGDSGHGQVQRGLISGGGDQAGLLAAGTAHARVYRQVPVSGPPPSSPPQPGRKHPCALRRRAAIAAAHVRCRACCPGMAGDGGQRKPSDFFPPGVVRGHSRS
jgi:hypothetical protein